MRLSKQSVQKRNLPVTGCTFRCELSESKPHGAGRATEIRLGEHDRVLAHTRRGYRKSSTGEYVAKAYLANFGWKNTYYQHAKTVVEVATDNV